ncbi:MAG: cohesin domain-containing protein [Methanophagales archaeon]|nr:cohesin domain-containing protein [Methanophagales archaeon]
MIKFHKGREICICIPTHKWILVIILLIFTLLLALTTTQSSETASTAIVSIGNLTSAPGETVTAPVLISNIENYGTGTLSIEYNPSIVHVTDVTSGPDSTVIAWKADNISGIVNISAWNISISGVSGTIIFANVSFMAVRSAGSTPLNLSVITLQNMFNEDILTTIKNGSFSIKPGIVIFDTGAPDSPYPSIMGVHNGTITPNRRIEVNRIYTYACPGTGGHTEYARIWGNGVDAHANWSGYTGNWHNLKFNTAFTLEPGKEYNYTIRTGSYPQIIHHPGEYNATGGKIACNEFIDANGKKYTGWIPAIKLWWEEE